MAVKGQKNKNSRTSARALKTIKRRQEAVRLRTEGFTYEEIAKELGFQDESGPRKAVLAAYRESQQETAEDTEVLRRIESDRTNYWHRKLVEASRSDESDMAKLASSAMAVGTRRAKLFGLDMPSQLELTDPDAAKGWDLTGWLSDELAEYEEIVASFDALNERVRKRLENE